MFRKMRMLGVLFVSAILLFAIAVACDKKDDDEGEGTKITITLSESELALVVGADHTLTATLSPEDADAAVTWSSDKETVATVEAGVVHAVAEGTAVITAAAGDASATCTVTVSEQTAQVVKPVLTVNETQAKVLLSGGKAEYEFDYTVTPAGAMVDITWDKSAEGVTRDGKKVTFTKTGTYVFTITAQNGGGSDSKTVTVTVENAPAPEFTTLPAKHLEATLQDAEYPSNCTLPLSYAVQAAGDLDVTLEETAQTPVGGWYFDAEEKSITFTRGGEFAFLLTASDENGEDTCEFTASITDLYPSSETEEADVIWQQNFDGTSKPAGWTETIGTPGTDTITYTENGVTLHKDQSGKSVFLQYDFDAPMAGVVEFTVEFKTASTGFVNLLFLRGDGDDYAVTVAIQDNTLMINEASGWNREIALFESTKTRLVPGEDYTLRAVADCISERVYLYLSGEHYIADNASGGAGENKALGEDVYLCNFDFRVNGEQIKAYRMGSDIQNAETEFTVYAITAKQIVPAVKAAAATAVVELEDGAAEYTFDYTVVPADATVTIECDKTDGVKIEEGKASFTKAGTYVFTITAENEIGHTGSAKVTVTVRELSAAPAFTTEQKDETLTLQTQEIGYTDLAANRPHIELSFAVDDPYATFKLEESKIGGWTYDEEEKILYFTRGGVYEFTLTATNSAGSTQETFKVTVTDTYAAAATENWTSFWSPDLTAQSVPAGWQEEETKGTGSISWNDDGVRIAGGNGNNAFVRGTVGEGIGTLSQFTVEFTLHDTGDDFTNIFFLMQYNAGGGSNTTISVGVDKGQLKVNQGNNYGKWKSPALFENSATNLMENVRYTLRVVLDSEAKRMYLYLGGATVYNDARTEEVELNGEVYLGNFKFRDMNASLQTYRAGADNNNSADFTIHSIVAKNAPAAAEE